MVNELEKGIQASAEESIGESQGSAEESKIGTQASADESIGESQASAEESKKGSQAFEKQSHVSTDEARQGSIVLTARLDTKNLALLQETGTAPEKVKEPHKQKLQETLKSKEATTTVEATPVEAEAEQTLQKAVNRVKLLKTALLIFTWFCRGYTNSLIGATLPDLRVRFGTDAAGMSYALAVGSMGGIVGSLCSALLDRYGRFMDLIFGFLMALMSLSALLRTSTTYLWLFTLCDFFDEFCWYTINPGGKSVVLGMWGVDSTPYMHAVLVGFPIGGTIGPLVAGLFVSSNSTDHNTTSFLPQPYCHDVMCYGNVDDMHANVINFALMSTYEDDEAIGYSVSDDRFPDDSSIQYAFYIAACFAVTSSVLFFIFYFNQREDKPLHKQVRKSSYTWKDIFSPSKWTEGKPRLGVSFIVCMIVFFVAMNSFNNAVGFYMPTYAVDSGLGFSNQEAAALSSLSSLSGSVSRIVSIFLSYYIAVHYLFIGYVCSTVISVLCLGVFGTRSKTNLIVFTAFYGFTWRPLRGYVYSYMNLYMFMIAAVFGLESFVVTLLLMPLTALNGYLYDETFIEVIFYIGFIYVCILFIDHIVILLIGRHYGTMADRRKAAKETSDMGDYIAFVDVDVTPTAAAVACGDTNVNVGSDEADDDTICVHM